MAGDKKTTGKRFEDMICPICKREFIVPDPGMWAYKIFNPKNSRYTCVCRWSCLQEDRRRKEKRKSRRKA